MKSIDEQIWDYIDNTCSQEEKLIVAAKIASDETYSTVYAELLQIHQLLDTEQLDEPSMSFTRNVMDLVELEIAPVSLKTKVDKRIIYAITAVFVLLLIYIVCYAAAHGTYAVADFKLPKMQISFDISQYITPLFMKIFLFVDVVLGLIYLDGFLRRKSLR